MIQDTMEGFACFSRFPMDIQRRIFEEAYEDSERRATQIALVSRQVQSWYEIANSFVANPVLNLQNQD